MEYGLNWMFEIWDKERRAGMTLYGIDSCVMFRLHWIHEKKKERDGQQSREGRRGEWGRGGGGGMRADEECKRHQGQRLESSFIRNAGKKPAAFRSAGVRFPLTILAFP